MTVKDVSMRGSLGFNNGEPQKNQYDQSLLDPEIESAQPLLPAAPGIGTVPEVGQRAPIKPIGD